MTHANLCNNLDTFFRPSTDIYGLKGKSRQGHGHSSKSSLKVKQLLNQHCIDLLLLDNHKKFEDDAFASFFFL